MTINQKVKAIGIQAVRVDRVHEQQGRVLKAKV